MQVGGTAPVTTAAMALQGTATRTLKVMRRRGGYWSNYGAARRRIHPLLFGDSILPLPVPTKGKW